MISLYLKELLNTLEEVRIQDKVIEQVAGILLESELVLTIGNGGSASTAQHFAQGLCNTGVKAISLTDNTSLLTAISNDESYKEALEWIVRLFSEGKSKVVIVAISASGGSLNIINALMEAGRLNVTSIGLLGFRGGKAATMVTVPIILSSKNYGIVEDAHLTICHLICNLISTRKRG